MTVASLALLAAAPGPPLRPAGGTVGPGAAAYVPFVAQDDGTLDLSLTFSGDEVDDVLMYALYDGAGDLREAGGTFNGFHGRIHRATDTAVLTRGEPYVLVAYTLAATGTVTVAHAVADGPTTSGLFRAQIHTFNSRDHLWLPGDGYRWDVFLNPGDEEILAVQMFATVHDGTPAANYGQGHMCLYGPGLPCRETAVDLEHVSVTAATDDLTIFSANDLLVGASTTALRSELEVYSDLRHGIYQLHAVTIIPTRLETD